MQRGWLTPLMVAAKTNSGVAVDLLLNKGADPNALLIVFNGEEK